MTVYNQAFDCVMYFVSAGVVSNKGQHPIATNDASTFLCTGPMCRYAVDLIPMLKIMAGSGCRKMRLDNEVK